jgi:hypothetical protein
VGCHAQSARDYAGGGGSPGDLLLLALGIVIGGIQLPKRGSRGSYRDLNLATMYSKASVIDPSRTIIQMGGRTPIRKAAINPMTVNATRPEIHFGFTESSLRRRGIISFDHLVGAGEQ